MRPSAWLWVHLGAATLAGVGIVLEQLGRSRLPQAAPILLGLVVCTGLLTVIVPATQELGSRKALAAFGGALAIGLATTLVTIFAGMPFGLLAHGVRWWPSIPLPANQLYSLQAPFMWLIIAAGSFVAAQKIFRPASYVSTGVLAGILAMLIQMPLEASLGQQMQLWVWLSPDWPIGLGAFGAPLINAAGWFLTATVAGFVLGYFGIARAATWNAAAAFFVFCLIASLPGAIGAVPAVIVSASVMLAMAVVSVIKSRAGPVRAASRATI